MARSTYVREPWQAWYRRDLLQMAYWPKYVASQTDWVHTSIDDLVSELVDAGITVLSWGAPENWFPINAGMQRRHPALDQRDGFYDELFEKCHQSGIRVLLGFSGNAGREGKAAFIEEHWDDFKKQGCHWDIPGVKLGGHEVCHHNPVFVEGQRQAVEALIRRYPLDATFIDHPNHVVPIAPDTREITCDYCRDAWQRESGMDRAPAEDWDDPAWRRFVAWHQTIHVGYLSTLADAIRAVDDRVLITSNMVARPVDGALSHTVNPAAMRGVIDSMCYESVFLNFNLLDVQLNLKFGYAVAGHNPTCILKNFELIFGQGYAHAKPSGVETRTLACLSLAHGAPVMLHSTMDENGRPHGPRNQVFTDTSRWLQPLLPHFRDAEPVASVAVVYSRATRDNYAGRNPGSFLASYQGAEQALVYNHVPSRTLLDEDLTAESLGRFKAVLLANVACMSDVSVQAVRDYVHGGGTILASYETSLYDEDERFRGGFGLADVLGVSFNGVLPLAEKIKSGVERFDRQPFRLDTTHPLLAGQDDSDILHVPWFSIRADGADAAGHWLQVRENVDHGSVNMAREIIGEYDEPCVTTHKFGKGTAIYFSGDVFYNFSLRPIRYYTDLFRRLLLGTGSLTAYSDGPKSLEMTVMRQDAEDLMHVHLVNLVNTNRWYNALVYSHSRPKDLARSGRRDDFADDAERAMAMAFRRKRTFDTTGPVDENLPLYDVPVSLHASLMQGRRVTLDGEALEADGTEEHGFSRFVVPRLDIYQRLGLERA